MVSSSNIDNPSNDIARQFLKASLFMHAAAICSIWLRVVRLSIFVVIFASLSAEAQQVSDDSFIFDNPSPAFSFGEGPAVCIDEGHNNFHTADGRYKPFAKLLRADGYKVLSFDKKFIEENLRLCDLIVIANPLSEENLKDWSYPHPSAFLKEEIRALMTWIREGGRLLLLADHPPMAGAARDLGAVLGIVMIDAYASGGFGPDQFLLSNETLLPHPILDGRFDSEKVDRVMTFTGQAVQITQGWEPLLVFGQTALARISLMQTFQEGPRSDWPSFSVAGWVHGATRNWDKGRIVFFGEAAMCSAQLRALDQLPMGMNHPLAMQNAQFCLSTVRWLTGVLDDK